MRFCFGGPNTDLSRLSRLLCFFSASMRAIRYQLSLDGLPEPCVEPRNLPPVTRQEALKTCFHCRVGNKQVEKQRQRHYCDRLEGSKCWIP